MSLATRVWLSVGLLGVVQACSHVRVSTNATDIIGRTMELSGAMSDDAAAIEWTIATYTREQKMGLVSPCGPASHAWENTHGFVAVQNQIGADGVGLQAVAEGMNEQGLTVSCQTLRASQYAPAESVSDASVSKVCFFDFGTA
jgi:penicillin V acylase-like amidase (Ntn superfamily)